jgi:hypothetical protein
LLFLLCAPAFAQNYSGTYTTANEQGGTVTLVLKQDGPKSVSGTLTGNNTTFQVKGEVTPDGFMGAVTGQQGNLYMMAKLEGPGLTVILAEPLPNGQPNVQGARRLAFARSAASKPQASPAPATGTDGQLTQLLTRTPWCSFAYNQRSGTTSRERVVFGRDGLVTQASGTETYSSGPAGSVAGQRGGGNQGRWKVQGGMLQLSQDGASWTPQPLQVTQNSNGYPIIKSGGKEYMQCR